MKNDRLLVGAVAACLIWTALLTVYVVTRPQLSTVGRSSAFGGKVEDSTALTLTDGSRPGEFLDLGRYEYGWTLMTPYRLEMHPGKEFSISCYGSGCLPRFQVRNVGDTEGAVWINGHNMIGSQFGPLRFAIGSMNSAQGEVARFEADGDLVLGHDLDVGGASLLETIAELRARIEALEGAGGQ